MQLAAGPAEHSFGGRPRGHLCYAPGHWRVQHLHRTTGSDALLGRMIGCHHVDRDCLPLLHRGHDVWRGLHRRCRCAETGRASRHSTSPAKRNALALDYGSRATPRTHRRACSRGDIVGWSIRQMNQLSKGRGRAGDRSVFARGSFGARLVTPTGRAQTAGTGDRMSTIQKRSSRSSMSLNPAVPTTWALRPRS